MPSLNHPILEQSFAVIDREIGSHSFTPAEYAIVRRVIHSTADFEFKELIRFSPDAIAGAVQALQQGVPIVVDVNMVKQGILSVVNRTFQNPIMVAVDQAETALPGKTRTETGLLSCWEAVPGAIYAIGNAPTALLALCERIGGDRIAMAQSGSASPFAMPPLVIGAPVGFISVVESKAALAQTPIPQIRVEGRKGGSAIAAAILNALLILAWEAT
ncbi:precorrin-8X methylmutase [Leptolyngbya sp. FACHB-711]|uniref:precorrin-8X methylmutase n=1 Tax=unclassified Leptolyngbya TaxID=2650499 RepID=UPI001686DE9F|nr:precorrin-8X methylmutase [Leptolyngbya sp. FACHB-711]MBD1851326.1 precorrin-8X methylmutase [Cyanobacteria bacterium FACHB-502]MBD2026583.1 precorrin-8X methylmutase [Leptolyngbya sp. FACHB-711]